MGGKCRITKNNAHTMYRDENVSPQSSAGSLQGPNAKRTHPNNISLTSRLGDHYVVDSFAVRGRLQDVGGNKRFSVSDNSETFRSVKCDARYIISESSCIVTAHTGNSRALSTTAHIEISDTGFTIEHVLS
jgi:hypothetical protein